MYTFSSFHFLSDGTTIHEAAKRGGLKAVRELIATGCRPNAEHENNIPIELASTHGHVEVVKFLIGADDDVDHISRGLISAAGAGIDPIVQGINIFFGLIFVKIKDTNVSRDVHFMFCDVSSSKRGRERGPQF